MKRINIIISLVLIFVISPLFISQLFSQPIPPPVQTPIGGGLGILALLGFGFIIRKKVIKNK